jgi:type I restriction enzyme, S subunit
MIETEQIPKIPLKYVASINDEALSENTDPDLEIKYIDIGNVESTGKILDIADYLFGEAPSRARRIVRHGDVIISTVRTYLQAIAAIEFPPENLIVSTGFAVVRSRQGKLLTGYCKYAIRETEFISEVISRSVGVSYPAITSRDLGDIPIYVPSYTSQEKIANFLDSKIIHIDSLIDAKQRLLKLLEEKRQSIISNAVTHGVNSKVLMRSIKDSWLYEKPTHWQIAPLKRWLKTKITDGPHETPDFDPKGIPFVSAEAVQNKRINFDSRWGNIPLKLHKKYAQKLLPQRNDIFMVKSGATTGKLAYVDVDIEFNVWSPLALIRADETKILSKFLLELLHADYVQRQVRETWSAGTQPNISMGAIEELIITVPPLNEQQSILDYLDREVGKIDNLLKTTQSSITLLSERRAALISAAVSGQLDCLKEESK